MLGRRRAEVESEIEKQQMSLSKVAPLSLFRLVRILATELSKSKKLPSLVQVVMLLMTTVCGRSFVVCVISVQLYLVALVL